MSRRCWSRLLDALPSLGAASLPDLGFAAGITATVIVGVLEPPVGIALLVGHYLTHHRHTQFAQEFGEALEKVPA